MALLNSSGSRSTGRGNGMLRRSGRIGRGGRTNFSSGSFFGSTGLVSSFFWSSFFGSSLASLGGSSGAAVVARVRPRPERRTARDRNDPVASSDQRRGQRRSTRRE